ncbi:hypothetical protein BOTBODRAFT_33650 [Botryobasidium botryosum FD-172 SS1]|uniref:DUF7729 domain-containing protein n=1 Tax=Botryobasidium botryosum (strain FD-172 SS1) TaxID=930990 RepID=A0A067MF99_BOTB1|nr:hypothetical protein BOTBODRAFT_33650 [Botryobasidium botryosum FD-172 SS1]
MTHLTSLHHRTASRPTITVSSQPNAKPGAADLPPPAGNSRRLRVPLYLLVILILVLCICLRFGHTVSERLALRLAEAPSHSVASAPAPFTRASLSKRKRIHRHHAHHSGPARSTSLKRVPNGAIRSAEGVSPDAVPYNVLLASPTVAPESASKTTPGQNGQASNVAPPVPATPLAIPTPFPQPWDTSLPYAFSTNSCAAFFKNLLSNSTFRSCRAFSLLLPTSSALFQVEGNLTALTATVGGTCNTPIPEAQCVDIMDAYARQISQDSICGKDLGDKVPAAVQALNGFKSYKVMRDAACLINQRTGAYCFIEAAAAKIPSDLYFYNLPVGVPIPPYVTPSCSPCVESLMSVYASYANNSSLALASTYPAAAVASENRCGTQYATIVDVNGMLSTNAAAGTLHRSPGARSLLWGVVVGLGAGMYLLV